MDVIIYMASFLKTKKSLKGSMLKDILTYPKSNLVSLINTCPQTYDKNPSLTKDSFNLPLVLFAILSKLFTLKLVSSM